eukprot:COSAG02_NODE_4271_length_5563_cov_3.829063_3_plen_90_part_00
MLRSSLPTASPRTFWHCKCSSASASQARNSFLCCLVRHRYKAARQIDLEAQQRRAEAAAHSVLDALGPIALKAFGTLLAHIAVYSFRNR